MAHYLNRDDLLRPDLRLGHVRRQQGGMARLRSGGTAASVPRPGPDSRAAVVKVWGASPGTTGRHLRYLTRGKGTDGTDTTLFKAQGFVRDPQAFTQAAVQDPHQYRMVISVLGGDALSLVRFTQALMRQVERDLRQPLDYIAATHRDTTYIHTHLVVRGRTAAGETLLLPRHYVTHGLRWRVMHLATARLGKVPHQERAAQRQRASEVSLAMDKQVREAKKEDGMEDARFPTQRDADPQPDVPPSQDQTRTEGGQTLLQRLQVLLERVQEAQQQAKTKDRGMGL
jgi:hypothetical protein